MYFNSLQFSSLGHVKQKGAVLVAVLVIAVVITLLLSTTSIVMSNRLVLAADMTRLTNDKIAMHASMQELIYLASTQRKTKVGISRGTAQFKQDDTVWGDEIRIDGHPYTMDVNGIKVTYSVQAETGLLAINTQGGFLFREFLAQQGLSELQARRLADALYDFADENTQRRALGAEEREYKALNEISQIISYPTNYLLQSPEELRLIKHWEEFFVEHPNVYQFFSLRRQSDINFNAMPIALWQVLWPHRADKIASQRNQGKWFNSFSELHSDVPELARYDEDYKILGGGGSFIIRLSTEQTTRTYRLVTPRNSPSPIKVYAY